MISTYQILLFLEFVVMAKNENCEMLLSRFGIRYYILDPRGPLPSHSQEAILWMLIGLVFIGYDLNRFWTSRIDGNLNTCYIGLSVCSFCKFLCRRFSLRYHFFGIYDVQMQRQISTKQALFILDASIFKSYGLADRS